MNTTKHVVYRSQQEQMYDEFMMEHPEIVLVALGVALAMCVAILWRARK
jgi:hypothetical protein